MSNPLFNMLGNNNQFGQMGNLIQQFQQFKSNFKGDPQQQIQQMLNSGQITQEQYNNAVKMANAFQSMLNKM